MALIEVENLTKVYDDGKVQTPVLYGISFLIEQGDFVSIMGPSGSGKSTLLHVLGFLDKATSGTYRFDGKVADEYGEEEAAHVRNQRMGFVFQTFNLLARTSVLENVKLPMLYSLAPERSWDEMARKAIEDVGLSHRLSHEPSQLSGGERQRVAIARALVNNPSVVFADEPTGNLDTKSGDQVMEIMAQLNKKGCTVIVITHEAETAKRAERILHIRDGKIEKDEKVLR
jgi:putative ABC transport system ATP-binding protein